MFTIKDFLWNYIKNQHEPGQWHTIEYTAVSLSSQKFTAKIKMHSNYTPIQHRYCAAIIVEQKQLLLTLILFRGGNDWAGKENNEIQITRKTDSKMWEIVFDWLETLKLNFKLNLDIKDMLPEYILKLRGSSENFNNSH